MYRVKWSACFFVCKIKGNWVILHFQTLPLWQILWPVSLWHERISHTLFKPSWSTKTELAHHENCWISFFGSLKICGNFSWFYWESMPSLIPLCLYPQISFTISIIQLLLYSYFLALSGLLRFLSPFIEFRSTEQSLSIGPFIPLSVNIFVWSITWIFTLIDHRVVLTANITFSFNLWTEGLGSLCFFSGFCGSRWIYPFKLCQFAHG